MSEMHPDLDEGGQLKPEVQKAWINQLQEWRENGEGPAYLKEYLYD